LNKKKESFEKHDGVLKLASNGSPSPRRVPPAPPTRPVQAATWSSSAARSSRQDDAIRRRQVRTNSFPARQPCLPAASYLSTSSISSPADAESTGSRRHRRRCHGRCRCASLTSYNRQATSTSTSGTCISIIYTRFFDAHQLHACILG
jgi:hypothetical protein